MHACITIDIEEAYSTAETETEAIQQASYETLINTAYSFKTIPQQLLKFHQRGRTFNDFQCENIEDRLFFWGGDGGGGISLSN